jgi:hypothetical protein
LPLGDFFLAKVCFFLAAADAMGSVVMWGANATSQPWLAMAIVFVSTGGLAVLCVQSFRYVEAKAPVHIEPQPRLPTAAEIAEEVRKQSQQESKLGADLEYLFFGRDALYFNYVNHSKDTAEQPRRFSCWMKTEVQSSQAPMLVSGPAATATAAAWYMVCGARRNRYVGVDEPQNQPDDDDNDNDVYERHFPPPAQHCCSGLLRTRIGRRRGVLLNCSAGPGRGVCFCTVLPSASDVVVVRF